jgi:hypothetical protein
MYYPDFRCKSFFQNILRRTTKAFIITVGPAAPQKTKQKSHPIDIDFLFSVMFWTN